MSKANEIAKAIVSYLNGLGHCAMRNNSAGIWDPTSKIHRKPPPWSRATGSGDILCCLQGGRWLEIEIKVGRDRLSPAQEDRRDKIVDLGGLFWVVKDTDDFLKQYEELNLPGV